LVRAIGEKGEEFMKKRSVKYTNEPIGKVQIIPDFLPSPNELVLKDKTIKVTLSLTKESVDFFKREANAHHAHYQQMIRELLAQYATYHREKDH